MTRQDRQRLEAFARDLARTCMAHGIPLDGENPTTHDLITVTIEDDGRAVARIWHPNAKVIDPPDVEEAAAPIPF